MQLLRKNYRSTAFADYPIGCWNFKKTQRADQFNRQSFASFIFLTYSSVLNTIILSVSFPSRSIARTFILIKVPGLKSPMIPW